jgi:hypothetical protein
LEATAAVRPATVTAAATLVFIQSTIVSLVALGGLFVILFLNPFQEHPGMGALLTDGPLFTAGALILLATGLVGLVTAVGLLGLRHWATPAAAIFEGANLPILVAVGLNFDAAGAASDPGSLAVFLGFFALLPLAVVGLLFLPRFAG